jgi:hypothetical protein
MEELDLAYMSIDTLKNRVHCLEKEVETLQARIRKMLDDSNKEFYDRNYWKGGQEGDEDRYYGR